jgi:putative endonuclease
MGIDRSYSVYILARDIGGTLYIGVANDLVRCVYEHRTNAVPGFSGRYGVHRFVYYEQLGDIEFAIRREKRLKKWNRASKIELIGRHTFRFSIRCAAPEAQPVLPVSRPSGCEGAQDWAGIGV